MKIYQFRMLDEMEQIEAFWAGMHIGKRMEDKYLIECRQIDGFYVEYKRDMDIGMYVDMRAFTNPDLLEPYFDQLGNIDVNEKV